MKKIFKLKKKKQTFTSLNVYYLKLYTKWKLADITCWNLINCTKKPAEVLYGDIEPLVSK